MIRRFGIAGLVAMVLLGAVVVSLILFTIMLGPARAMNIAAAAALSTTVDGLAEDPGPHCIPVLDLAVDPAALDSLQLDLPWSGGANVRALLHENDIDHKVKFRYRGVFTPSHFLGGKKSFRLAMKSTNPWSPYRRVNVINPKAFNLVNDHMAAWVAGSMGVPVPMNEMVLVRINGEDQGVMELFEQVDGDFERNRHLAQHEVPVYKGDYPPVTERALPKGRTLWQSAAHWEYASDADSTIAHAKLVRLVAALVRDTASVATHRDSIAKLVDVDAFLRYQAALVVINSIHIDQYHNQWLVLDPRTGRFYPVLWDALLMFAPADEGLYSVHDALEWWMLRVPEWRLQRDRYVYEALLVLQREGSFDARLNMVIERISPSVLADRNKFGNVTLSPEDVHRFSVVHVISSLAGFRGSVHAYWERTLARMEATDVAVERGSVLRLRTTTEAPLRLSWIYPWEAGSVGVSVNGKTVEALWNGSEYTVVLQRTLAPAPGSKDHPLADKQCMIVEPLDATVSFSQGIPADLRITNAITDEAITSRP